MRHLFGPMLLVASLFVTGTDAQAEPGGCFKYGAVGAVGGHLVHHGVMGALGGCATGMYKRHAYRKDVREKAALYEKEHPGAKGSDEEKATAYEVEHSVTPGKTAPSDKAGAGDSGNRNEF